MDFFILSFRFLRHYLRHRIHWLKSFDLTTFRQWFLNYDDYRANLCIADETWVGSRDLAQWKRPGTQIKALSFKGGQDCCPWHWWNAPGRGDNRWLFLLAHVRDGQLEDHKPHSFRSCADRHHVYNDWTVIEYKDIWAWELKIQLSTALQNHISILGVQLFGFSTSVWWSTGQTDSIIMTKRTHPMCAFGSPPPHSKPESTADSTSVSWKVVNEANIWKSNIAWFDDKWF